MQDDYVIRVNGERPYVRSPWHRRVLIGVAWLNIVAAVASTVSHGWNADDLGQASLSVLLLAVLADVKMLQRACVAAARSAVGGRWPIVQSSSDAN